MITLKVAYDDSSEDFVKELSEVITSRFPLITLESYHENLFKERKKAFKLKGGYSARKSPFAVGIDQEGKPIAAFYTESDTCTVDNIVNTLFKFIVY